MCDIDDINIIDINNDGQIDLLDVKVIRESIVVTKQETIDFIVENSKEDNINFLSNVLNESDEKNVGQSIDKIFDTKNDQRVFQMFDKKRQTFCSFRLKLCISSTTKD